MADDEASDAPGQAGDGPDGGAPGGGVSAPPAPAAHHVAPPPPAPRPPRPEGRAPGRPDTPTQAYLKLIQPKPGGSEIDRVTFAFNPKEYTIQKSASWHRVPQPAARAMLPDFGGATPSTTSLEIFLDGYENGTDISRDIEVLFSTVCPIPSTVHSRTPSAPWVVFGWGTFSYTAVVNSVSVRYSLFDQTGKPVRATATLSLEEVPTDNPAGQNPTSGAETSSRSHVVVDGDTLASIAYQHYRDATAWRAIAEANDIDDPFRLRVGRRLLVPSPAEALAPA